jgi:hypothetical protein
MFILKKKNLILALTISVDWNSIKYFVYFLIHKIIKNLILFKRKIKFDKLYDDINKNKYFLWFLNTLVKLKLLRSNNESFNNIDNNNNNNDNNNNNNKTEKSNKNLNKNNFISENEKNKNLILYCVYCKISSPEV